MSDTRKIIPLEDNTPKRDASRLEGQNEGCIRWRCGNSYARWHCRC